MFHSLISICRRSLFPEATSIALAITTIGVGVSMVIVPEDYYTARTFRPAMDFASPQAWGTALILTSLIIVFLVFANKKYVTLPLFVLGVIWATWATLMVVGSFSGVPSPAFIYSFASWLSIGLAGVFWLEAHEERKDLEADTRRPSSNTDL